MTALHELARLAVRYEGNREGNALRWAIFVMHRAFRADHVDIEGESRPVRQRDECVHGHVGWMKQRSGAWARYQYCMECARLRKSRAA